MAASSLKTSLLRKPGPWFAVVALGSLAAVLYARLIPFSFAWDGRLPLERLTLAPLNIRDVPLNMLLFMPLGFGLAGVLERRRATGGSGQSSVVRAQVLAAALLLSAALEAIQLFMPDRVPSLADVLANAVGALAGYGLFRAWEMGFGRALSRYATRRNLLLGLGLYILGAAVLTATLNRSVRLDNWDTSFPLAVGNEAVGKRQWSGQVDGVWLEASFDGSPEYAAYYDFSGETPFKNKFDSDMIDPLLDWQEGPTSSQVGDGVRVGPGEWLATEGAFRAFSEAARRTDNFIIRTTVATADPAQRGPARIVSVSADAERRNVTLGQERDALIIRLRTPAGGENGQKPEALVPSVFVDGRPRHINVEYDAPMLRVWIDGEVYALSLAPGLAFFPGFATENRWAVEMAGNPYRYDWAYWGIVVGLGILVFGGVAAASRLAGRNETQKGHGLT